MLKTKPPSPPAPTATKKGASTVVFGESLEKGDFLKTPRALIYIRAFDDPKAKALKAHHIHLILALAGKQFQKKMIRRYWLHLSRDLGVSRDSARRWAYELRDLGLIKIIQFTGKSELPIPKDKSKTVHPGRRNDANGFDLSPLIDLITRAAADLKEKRLERMRRRAAGGDK